MLKKIQTILLGIQLTLATLWLYQGLVPKIIYPAADELRIWELQGIDKMSALTLMPVSGGIEIVFGLCFVIFRQSRLLHILNILGMFGLSLMIAVIDVNYYKQAFNPFVMNVSMASLSVLALQMISLTTLVSSQQSQT